MTHHRALFWGLLMSIAAAVALCASSFGAMIGGA